MTPTVCKLNKGNSERNELKIKSNGNKKSICWSTSLMMVYFWVGCLQSDKPRSEAKLMEEKLLSSIENIEQKRSECVPFRHHIQPFVILNWNWCRSRLDEIKNSYLHISIDISVPSHIPFSSALPCSSFHLFRLRSIILRKNERASNVVRFTVNDTIISLSGQWENSRCK